MSKALKFSLGFLATASLGVGGYVYYKNPKAFEKFEFNRISFEKINVIPVSNYKDHKENIQKQEEETKNTNILLLEAEEKQKLLEEEEKQQKLLLEKNQQIEQQLSEEREQNLKQVNELKESLEKHKSEIEKLNKDLAQNLSELEDLKIILSSHQKNSETMKTASISEIEALQNEIKTHRETMSLLEHEKKHKEEELKQEIKLLEEKMNSFVESEKENTQKELLQQKEQLEKEFKERNFERIENLSTLQSKVFITEEILLSNLKFIDESSHFQKLSLILLSLQETLETNGPFQPELNEILELCKDDEFTKIILQSIPDDVAKLGVETCLNLSQEFSKLKNDAIGLSYIPNSSGFLGKLFAKVISKLLIKEKGFVDGDAPDAILARSEYYLEQKRLKEAVEELEKLDGKCAEYLNGFIKKAKQRLIAEQMFEILKAHYMNQLEKIQ